MSSLKTLVKASMAGEKEIPALIKYKPGIKEAAAQEGKTVDEFVKDKTPDELKEIVRRSLNNEAEEAPKALDISLQPKSTLREKLKKGALVGGAGATGYWGYQAMGDDSASKKMPAKAVESQPAPEYSPPPKESSKPQAPAAVYTPQAVERLLKQHDTTIASGDETLQRELGPQKAKLDSLEAAYREAYKENRDRTAWAEVAEKMGQALVQFGAGLYGLKTGVDLGGLQFSKTNWEARYDRLLDELKTDLAGLTNKRAALVDVEKDRRGDVRSRAKTGFAARVEQLKDRQGQLDSLARIDAQAKALQERTGDKDENKAYQKDKDLWNKMYSDIQNEKGDVNPPMALSRLKTQAKKLGMSDERFNEIVQQQRRSTDIGTIDIDSVRNIAAEVNAQLDFTLPQSTQPRGEMVKMQAPNGEVRLVPAKDVNALLRQGAIIVREH